MEKIKLAVVGVGYLGAFHVEKCARLPMIELVAISEVNPERCAAIAAQYQVEGYTDYRELADKVDAVCIVVPASYHFEVAHYFLSRGIHVFLEKPMATCVTDARELVIASRTHNSRLQIGFIERFNPVVKKLKEIITQPVLIESSRLAGFSPRGTDVSVVLDLMIHDIDILHFLFNDTPQLKSASGCRVESDYLDEVTAHFTLNDKIDVYVTSSRVSTQKQRVMRVVEADRIIQADFGSGCIDVYPTLLTQNPERIQLEKRDLLLDELEAFAQAIVHQQPPVVSGEMGIKTLEATIQVQTMVTQPAWVTTGEVAKYRELLLT